MIMQNNLVYLVMKRSSKKIIKQFSNYDEAFEFCLEKKHEFGVVLIQMETETYQVTGTIVF